MRMFKFIMVNAVVLFMGIQSHAALSITEIIKSSNDHKTQVSISGYQDNDSIYKNVDLPETAQNCSTNSQGNGGGCTYHKNINIKVSGSEYDLSIRPKSIVVTVKGFPGVDGWVSIDTEESVAQIQLPKELAPGIRNGGLELMDSFGNQIGKLSCQSTTCSLIFNMAEEVHRARQGESHVRYYLSSPALFFDVQLPYRDGSTSYNYTDSSKVSYIHPYLKEGGKVCTGFNRLICKDLGPLKKKGFRVSSKELEKFLNLVHTGYQTGVIENILTKHQLSVFEKEFKNYSGLILQTEKIKIESENGRITSSLTY